MPPPSNLRQCGRFSEAEAHYCRALEQMPDSAEIRNNRAGTLERLHRYEQAEIDYRRALELKPDFAEARFNLGMLLLSAGRYTEGWEYYEARSEAFGEHGQLPFPQWNGEDLNGKTLLLHHRGRPDQALALIAWPTLDNLTDPQKVRDIRVLEQIIQLRLFAQLRVVDGAAYEAQTGLDSSETFPGYGDVYAFAEVPPGKTDLFFDVVSKITADLRAYEVSADELERGRRPRVELFTQNQQNNSYWLGSLSNAQSEPAKLDLIRSTIPDLKKVTAAGIHRAAMDYFTDEKAFKLVILPVPPATTPATPIASSAPASARP